MGLMEQIIVAHFNNEGYSAKATEDKVFLVSPDGVVHTEIMVRYGMLSLVMHPNVAMISALAEEVSGVVPLDTSSIFDRTKKADIKKSFDKLLRQIQQNINLFSKAISGQQKLSVNQRKLLDKLKKDGFTEDFRFASEKKNFVVVSKDGGQLVFSGQEIFMVGMYRNRSGWLTCLNSPPIEGVLIFPEMYNSVVHFLNWNDSEYLEYMKVNKNSPMLPIKGKFVSQDGFSADFFDGVVLENAVRLEKLFESITQPPKRGSQEGLSQDKKQILIDLLNAEFANQVTNLGINGVEIALAEEPNIRIERFGYAGEQSQVLVSSTLECSAGDNVKSLIDARISWDGVLNASVNNDETVQRIVSFLIRQIGELQVVQRTISNLLEENTFDELSGHFEIPEKLIVVESTEFGSTLHIPVRDKFFDETVTLIFDYNASCQLDENYVSLMDKDKIYGIDMRRYMADRAERIKNTVLSEIAQTYGLNV